MSKLLLIGGELYRAPPKSPPKILLNKFTSQIYFFLLSKLAGFSSFDTTRVYNIGPFRWEQQYAITYNM